MMISYPSRDTRTDSYGYSAAKSLLRAQAVWTTHKSTHKQTQTTWHAGVFRWTNRFAFGAAYIEGTVGFLRHVVRTYFAH